LLRLELLQLQQRQSDSRWVGLGVVAGVTSILRAKTHSPSFSPTSLPSLPSAIPHLPGASRDEARPLQLHFCSARAFRDPAGSTSTPPRSAPLPSDAARARAASLYLFVTPPQRPVRSGAQNPHSCNPLATDPSPRGIENRRRASIPPPTRPRGGRAAVGRERAGA